MVLPVIASKVNDGVSKEGKRYHWCSLWIPLDDGTLYEVRSNIDFKRGDKVEFSLASRFGKLDLIPVSLARE